SLPIVALQLILEFEEDSRDNVLLQLRIGRDEVQQLPIRQRRNPDVEILPRYDDLAPELLDQDGILVLRVDEDDGQPVPHQLLGDDTHGVALAATGGPADEHVSL